MLHQIGLRSAICLVVFCLGGSTALAAPDWPVARGPAREPVPFRYDRAQWQDVPSEFLDDAPACTLYSGLTYIIEPDGTVETITHEITRFNSRKAVEKLGEYRNIAYDPAFETLTLNEARVLKADGRIVPVEPKHVQLRDTVTDFQVYDHSKQLVISFPTLETGDSIEVKWTTRGKNPEYRGRFFTRYTFGDDLYPVACDEVRVRLPKTCPLKFAVTGGTLEPTIHDEGNQRTYHWRSTNRPQLPLDENQPPKEDRRLQLSFSTFASWDEVFQWECRIRNDCWTGDEELRKVVQEVTKDLKTPLEKARALTFWVRRHIRYVSVGEKHDYTPHQPALVLDNRYGDCKDSSQLLAVMLREARVPVALVTLGVLDDGQVLPEVPSPWGTHAILLATIDGKDHWIDTTATLAGWDQMPREDRDRLCYVTDEKGLRLVRTPPLTPADYRIEQMTTLTIGKDGSSHCERSARYSGLTALNRRYDWVDIPSGERRRLLTAELQDTNSRSRLASFSIDPVKLQDYDQPVEARMVFTVQSQFNEDDDHSGSLEGSICDSVVWSKLLSINLDYDRAVALELPAPFESVHRYSIRMSPSYCLESLPADLTIASKWGLFRLSVKANEDDPRHLDLEYFTRIEQVRIDPADFEKFRKFREAVARSCRTWLTLKPVPDESVVPLRKEPVAPGDR